MDWKSVYDWLVLRRLQGMALWLVNLQKVGMIDYHSKVVPQVFNRLEKCERLIVVTPRDRIMIS